MSESLKIRKIEIPIAIGSIVEVEVPESLVSADRPLAIRVDPTETNIEIWTWGHPKLVKGLFLMLGDNSVYTFEKDEIRLRRHFGTVFGLFKKRFGTKGNAIHLFNLYKSELV